MKLPLATLFGLAAYMVWSSTLAEAASEVLTAFG